MPSNWVKFAEKSGVKLSPVTNTCRYCSCDKYWSGLCYNHYHMWCEIDAYASAKEDRSYVFGNSRELIMRDYIRLLKKHEPIRYAEIITKMNMRNILK